MPEKVRGAEYSRSISKALRAVAVGEVSGDSPEASDRYKSSWTTGSDF